MCSNDQQFNGIRESLDGVPVHVFTELSALFSASFPHVSTSWYQLDSSHGAFLVNLLEFFATQFFQGDIRLRKLWLMTAIDVESQVCGENADPKTVCRQLLNEFKEDINLWTAYGSVLSRYKKWKV